MNKPGVLYPELNFEEKPTEIESLCMNCYKQGITKLLLTKIPHFKQVILSSFYCAFCEYSNNELQSANEISQEGIKITLSINSKEDLNRQIIKSEYGILRIKELELELPKNKRPILTTVEGILTNIIEDLATTGEHLKDSEKTIIAEIAKRLQEIINMKNSETATLELIDPSGNSYIEDLQFPKIDKNLKTKKYFRSREENEMLDINSNQIDQENRGNTPCGEKVIENSRDNIEDIHTFPAKCSSCENTCETRMHLTDIPYFKQVVIMSTTCDSCGYKSNEVKGGGAVSEKARRITLRYENSDDLSRDILKSETCGLSIPEIELELAPGSLGGRFTTVEGLITQVKEELEGKLPYIVGDSLEKKGKQTNFLDKLEKIIKGEIMFHLVLDDPLANSYIQNLNAPEKDDQLDIIDYERSFEQNEDLGLNDMKTENY